MKQLLFFAVMILIATSSLFGGSLSGVVRDAQTHNPIAGVNVTVHVVNPDSVAFPATTDQNGAYSITGIIPNNKFYVAMTVKAGYVFSYTRIDNLGSLDLVYDIDLTPESAPSGNDSSIVSGTIMSPGSQTGSLTAVANVQLKFTSGNQNINAVTNAEGKYTAKVPLNSYTVSVTATGYNTVTLSGIQVGQTGATLNAVLKNNVTGVGSDEGSSAPTNFIIMDAFPSPFNPSTTIQFSLPEQGYATVRVYNILGKEVALLAEGEFTGGTNHRVTFDASNLSSGIYFARLEFKSQSVMRKVMLMK